MNKARSFLVLIRGLWSLKKMRDVCIYTLLKYITQKKFTHLTKQKSLFYKQILPQANDRFSLWISTLSRQSFQKKITCLLIDYWIFSIICFLIMSVCCLNSEILKTRTYINSFKLFNGLLQCSSAFIWNIIKIVCFCNYLENNHQ